MDRRTLLSSAGAGIAGLSTGAILLSQTNTATASVSAGTLDISGAEKTTDDGTISDVVATVEGDWSYDLPSGKSPDTWQVVLQAGKAESENVAIVAAETGDAKYLNNNGTYNLNGSLVETDIFNTSDFEAEDAGDTTTVKIDCYLWLQVFNSSDRILAKATLQDTAEVTITEKAYEASRYGSASGSGSLNVIA